MSLNGALSISAGGLANVAAGLSVVSQNVANASTPQYAVERATQTSLSAGGQGLGVQSGVVVRATDPALQSEVSAQTAESSAAAETNAALATIEPALGTVAGESDLGSRLTAVQSAFSALLVDPANGTQQSSVVRAAAGLARGINTLSAAYGGARQSAQNGVVAGVAQLNTALSRIGGLDKQIVTQKAQGLSTADLENQRAQAEATVSGLVSARFIDRADGSVAVLTTGGAQLPTDGAQTLLATAATVGPTATYPGGGLPGVTLGGTDITAQLTGGTIGANIALRDNILPTYQGALDEFAQNLASRFSAQGLTLFTDATGAVPTSTGPAPQTGYVGFAGTIQINPAVSATLSLVRDGTQAVAGSPTGAAAFTPNPAGGPAGFTTLITRVLDYALGSQAQPGVAQAPIATAGLGPQGTLAANFAPQTTLSAAIQALSAAQAADSANASTTASDAAGVQVSLQAKLTSSTGVDMNTELGRMVVLQNAFGANAKVISAIQQMFQTTLSMVGP